MTRLKLWAAAAGAFVLALAGAWLKGRASTQGKVKELQGYADTRKRMDEADIVGDDPAAARVFLAERGKRDRDL